MNRLLLVLLLVPFIALAQHEARCAVRVACPQCFVQPGDPCTAGAAQRAREPHDARTRRAARLSFGPAVSPIPVGRRGY